MADVATFLSLCIAIGQLALWALFWYFVADLLTTMPANVRMIFKCIVLMLAIFYSLQAVLGARPAPATYRSLDSPTPSIMAPERR